MTPVTADMYQGIIEISLLARLTKISVLNTKGCVYRGGLVGDPEINPCTTSHGVMVFITKCHNFIFMHGYCQVGLVIYI